jgi:protein TonB
MFETSVIHAEVVGERRYGLISVSLVGHALVVVGILGASIRTIDFPTRAPAEHPLLVLAPPLSIPPALGTPNGGHKQSAPPIAVKQKTDVPNLNLAPSTMPDHAVPLAPSTTTGDPTPSSDGPGSDRPLGQPWGDEYGVGAGGPPVVAAPVAPEIPVRVGGDVLAPVVIRRVSPPYPRPALAARMNGSVIVECIIDKTGRVRDARVIRTTSSLFDQSAIEAVLQWQFTPGSLHGTPVDTIFDLTVTFRVSS